jgi:hypothetical protein
VATRLNAASRYSAWTNTERRWPRELVRKWGHLVGVVEAMPCASRKDAAVACVRALAAYERARGNSPSVVPQEDR